MFTWRLLSIHRSYRSMASAGIRGARGSRGLHFLSGPALQIAAMSSMTMVAACFISFLVSC